MESYLRDFITLYHKTCRRIMALVDCQNVLWCHTLTLFSPCGEYRWSPWSHVSDFMHLCWCRVHSVLGTRNMSWIYDGTQPPSPEVNIDEIWEVICLWHLDIPAMRYAGVHEGWMVHEDHVMNMWRHVSVCGVMCLTSWISDVSVWSAAECVVLWMGRYLLLT